MSRDVLPSSAVGTVGKTVAGKYALSRILGEGGMGAVYEAEHVEIGKRVAIKIVRELRGQEEEAAARFIREARAASAVESDHIVQVFDVGQDPDLGLYMVMELLSGEDLGSLLSRLTRLSPPIACAITDQAASGLAGAHAAGVIHRDLKPENVFLRARDDGSAVVKLVDFGIAKVVREARSAQSGHGVITRSGSVLGSPCYMSPEQAQGLAEVDHRSDIYSLGAVLYEMLVGKRAFGEKATYEQTILPILTTTAPRVSASVKTIAPALDQLVADMMSPKPDDRPSSMREVRRRLAKIQPGVDETRLRIPVQVRGPGSPATPGHRTHAGVVTDRTEAETLSAEAPIPLVHASRSWKLGVVGIAALALGTVVWVWVGRTTEPPVLPSAEPVAATAPAPSAPAVVPSAPSAERAAEPAPSASASAAASATPSAAPSAVVSATRPRPGPGPRPPPKPGDQVGGVGITTAF